MWLSKKADSHHCRQILIVRLELHLILEEYPLQHHPSWIFLIQIIEFHSPLQYPSFNLISDPASLAIGCRCSRGTTRQRARIIHAQTHNLIGHGTLGNIHHHNHHHAINDNDSDARVHSKPPIFVEMRLGIRIVFDGDVDEFVFGGGVDVHRDGRWRGHLRGFLGRWGDDFVVWIIVGGGDDCYGGFVGELGFTRCAHFKYEEHKRCALFWCK
jgi:hypothetical protein